MIRVARWTQLAIALLVAPGIAAAQMPVAKVVVTEAEVLDAQSTIVLVGTVLPVRRSRVSARIGGMVYEMPVRQGDFVEAGGLLAKLRDDTLRLRLAAEEARLDGLKARHAELVSGTRPEELRRLKALYEAEVAERERWAFEMERIEGLRGAGDSNEKEYVDIKAQYITSGLRKIATEAAYKLGLEGPRKEEVARAAFDVAEQQAIVDQLSLDITKKTIQSPFAGYVAQRMVEVGEWIPEGGQVVELVDLSAVLVRIYVPESSLPYLAVGDAARVNFDALGRSLTGHIKHIMRQADESARTFPVEIEVANDEGLLAAGMFARATVAAGAKGESVVVPRDAVVERDGQPYVGVVMPGRQGMSGVLMPVTLGLDVDDRVTITSRNVHPGMQVIVRGTEWIAPFPMPVVIVDENGTPVDTPAADGQAESHGGH